MSCEPVSSSLYPRGHITEKTSVPSLSHNSLRPMSAELSTERQQLSVLTYEGSSRLVGELRESSRPVTYTD